MDVFIIIGFTAALFFYYTPMKSLRNFSNAALSGIDPARVVQNVALNPEMIHVEDAFMEIANELGFY